MRREAATAVGHAVTFRTVTLVGFSAGHGAVRAILRDSAHFARVDAVLLIDGLHTSYVPEGTLLDKGGALDTTNLVAFAALRARSAPRAQAISRHALGDLSRDVREHDGDDGLARAELGLHRTPVVRWGPRGMQQLSEATSGRFTILGFAGNSAPDHIDQFQSMPELLSRLLKR